MSPIYRPDATHHEEQIMARYKDRSMQTMFDACLADGADRTSEFFIDGKPRRGAGHRNAYWNGFNGVRLTYSPNTLAFACFMAGRENAKHEV